MEQTRPTYLWIFSLGRWYVFSTFYATTTSSCQSCTLGFRGPNNCGKCILLIAIFNIYTSFVNRVCFNLTCYFGSFRFCLSDIRKFNMLRMCNSESSYFNWYTRWFRRQYLHFSILFLRSFQKQKYHLCTSQRLQSYRHLQQRKLTRTCVALNQTGNYKLRSWVLHLTGCSSCSMCYTWPLHF
jgi:hypothetical protein